MKSNFKIVMVGAPGSGKGTQSTKLAEKLCLPHISTGEIFRGYIASKHPLGKLIESYIGKGELVPDELVIDIVAERLKDDDCKNGFILDGFPRSIAQAEMLDKVLKIDCVINLEVHEEVLLNRLLGRRVCSSCGRITHVTALKRDGVCPFCCGTLSVRHDDTSETVKHRMRVYERETKPIVDFYHNKGNLINIDSDKQPEEVFENILKALNEIC